MRKEKIIINLLMFLLTFIIFIISTSNIITVKAGCTVGVCDERNLDGPCCAKSGVGGEPDINGYCARSSTSDSGFKCIAYGGGGGSGGGRGIFNIKTGLNVLCDCKDKSFNKCSNYYGLTNIQYRGSCAPSANGPDICNAKSSLGPYFQYQSCSGGTPTSTITPGGPTSTPIQTNNLNCKCFAGASVCTNVCSFEKYNDVTYSSPIKCGVAASKFQSIPTAVNKDDWCRTEKKTKGDANLDNNVTVLDYYYFVLANSGAKIPALINPDFNGDNKIDSNDRAIIIKTLE